MRRPPFHAQALCQDPPSLPSRGCPNAGETEAPTESVPVCDQRSWGLSGMPSQPRWHFLLSLGVEEELVRGQSTAKFRQISLEVTERLGLLGSTGQDGMPGALRGFTTQDMEFGLYPQYRGAHCGSKSCGNMLRFTVWKDGCDLGEEKGVTEVRVQAGMERDSRGGVHSLWVLPGQGKHEDLCLIPAVGDGGYGNPGLDPGVGMLGGKGPGPASPFPWPYQDRLGIPGQEIPCRGRPARIFPSPQGGAVHSLLPASGLSCGPSEWVPKARPEDKLSGSGAPGP